MSWDRYDSYYLIAYPAESLVDTVISWGYDNIDCDDLFLDPVDPTFGREKNIHLTILGNLEEISNDKLKSAIGRESAIECRMGSIGVFTNNSKYDVVYIEVVGDCVRELNTNLSLSIRNSNRFPVYIPHITIAYVKKGRGDRFLDDRYFSGQKFKVEQVVLSLGLKEQTTYKLGK